MLEDVDVVGAEVFDGVERRRYHPRVASVERLEYSEGRLKVIHFNNRYTLFTSPYVVSVTFAPANKEGSDE